MKKQYYLFMFKFHRFLFYGFDIYSSFQKMIDYDFKKNNPQ